MNYIVEIESQYMQVPRMPHLHGVRHTLRYVRSIADHGLFYETCAKLHVYGYIDASHVRLISCMFAQRIRQLTSSPRPWELRSFLDFTACLSDGGGVEL